MGCNVGSTQHTVQAAIRNHDIDHQDAGVNCCLAHPLLVFCWVVHTATSTKTQKDPYRPIYFLVWVVQYNKTMHRPRCLRAVRWRILGGHVGTSHAGRQNGTAAVCSSWEIQPALQRQALLGQTAMHAAIHRMLKNTSIVASTVTSIHGTTMMCCLKAQGWGHATSAMHDER